MRKIRLMTMALLFCLIPCIGMFACTTKLNYLITALPSDSLLGTIEGADNQSEKIEGTTLTLKAKAKGTSQFVCWVKDNEKIVDGKKDEPSTLNLVYGKDTAGSYTAVFRKSETDFSSMLYTKIKSIGIDNFTQSEITEGIQINAQIEWARLDMGSTNFDKSYTFENLTTGETLSATSNYDVFYFGKLGQNLEYSFQGKIIVSGYDSNNTLTTQTYSINFSQNLTKNSEFNENGQFVLTGTFNNNAQVSLLISKL